MKIPDLRDSNLAYETGFHIGDGTMTFRKKKNEYCVAYYGNVNEKQFYQKTILPLLLQLFGFRPKVKTFRNSCYTRIYSKDLVLFKSQIIGLPVGNKNKLSTLPSVFTGRPTNLVKCLLAGIFDSDGSVKAVKRKPKLYPRLNITLKSKTIIEEIQSLFLSLGITSTVYQDKRFDKRIQKYTEVWRIDINGLNNLRRFVNQIPIRNPTHLRRIEVF